MKMRMAGVAMAVVGCLGSGSMAAEFELRQGLDIFDDNQSSVDALHSLTLLRELRPGLHFGQSLYSAAAGDGGGLFLGGFELLWRQRLSASTALEFGGFIGGGGGAFVVEGDGFMTRAHVTLNRRLTPTLSGTLGLSYTDITGSQVSAPAISLGFSKDLNLALSYGRGHSGAPLAGDTVIKAIKPIIRSVDPQGSTGRNGSDLDRMTTLGAELTFASGNNARGEVFMQALGAAEGGGEGYAEWQLGYRWLTADAGLRAFAEFGAGFAGGGDVDTGGGLIGSVGGGVVVPITRGFEAEFGAIALAAADGDFRAIAPFVRGSLTFGGAAGGGDAKPRQWQYSTGLTLQRETDDFRHPGSDQSGDPLLIETSLDLFLTDRTYFTGNAQTVVAGDAGGYAIGQLGLGHEFPLTPRWTLAVEGFVGAAGGGGIDTGGGLSGGARMELDYALSERLKLSGGIGVMQSRGGADPVTLHLGIKAPFTTFH